MSGRTVKCPICRKPYKVYMHTVSDQSACPACVRACSGAESVSAAKWMIRKRARLRNRWWSFQNWCRGYKWGPIQRCPACDHTTPYHYGDCPERAS